MSRGGASAVKDATPEGARRVPRIPLHERAPLWRAQHEGRDPWWWSRRPSLGQGGRTDLAAPHGTVCFATSAIGAMIERLWDPGLADPRDPRPQPVHEAALRRLVVYRVDDPGDAPVADLTDPKGGLPKEFCAEPYERTQGWADALFDDGARGLVHWLRLDPGDGRGVALFATGPDDGLSGFAYEAFDLVEEGRGIDLAGKLPASMFEVLTPPSGIEVQEGDADDIAEE